MSDKEYGAGRNSNSLVRRVCGVDGAVDDKGFRSKRRRPPSSACTLGSQLASVQDVSVSGCAPDASECVLKRNSNATIGITLTPSKDVKSVMTVVHGIIMNLPVPFPLPQPDACQDNGLACPLKAAQEYHYQATLPILKSYPKVKVDVKWELKNEKEEDLVCVIIPAKIH